MSGVAVAWVQHQVSCCNPKLVSQLRRSTVRQCSMRSCEVRACASEYHVSEWCRRGARCSIPDVLHQPLVGFGAPVHKCSSAVQLRQGSTLHQPSLTPHMRQVFAAPAPVAEKHLTTLAGMTVRRMSACVRCTSSCWVHLSCTSCSRRTSACVPYTSACVVCSTPAPVVDFSEGAGGSQGSAFVGQDQGVTGFHREGRTTISESRGSCAGSREVEIVTGSRGGGRQSQTLSPQRRGRAQVVHPLDLGAEIAKLKEKLQRSRRNWTHCVPQRASDKRRVVRVETSRGKFGAPPMPQLIPAELDQWMSDRQAELQEAISLGEPATVLELTSMMSDVAVHMREVSRQMLDQLSSCQVEGKWMWVSRLPCGRSCLPGPQVRGRTGRSVRQVRVCLPTCLHSKELGKHSMPPPRNDTVLVSLWPCAPAIRAGVGVGVGGGRRLYTITGLKGGGHHFN